jgi:hypothetical protein
VSSKITVGIFIALLFGLAVLNLAAPKRTFSANENRYLQQIPSLTLQTILDGKFTSGFDDFITDQFVFRDKWVGMKTGSELLLQKHASNGVYFANDGTLVEMFDSIDMERFNKNLDFIRAFQERVRDGLGLETQVMLVPTASMIYAHKLPAFAPEIDQRALLDQAAAIPDFIDVSPALAAHSDDYIFYATDHHWTSLGAFYAYNAWRGQNGLPARSFEDYDTEFLSSEFYGTTYSKASLYMVAPDIITAFYPKDTGVLNVDYNMGEKVTDSFYERSYLDVKDKYSVFLNANQSLVRIKTGHTNGKKLFLVKDSYANTFAQFLLSDYEEILVADLRFFKTSIYDFIAENGVTDIMILYNLKGFAADANVYFLTT